MKYWNDIEISDLDILFENRNKEYGAYFLRKEYNRRLTIAFVSTCSLFILLLIFPFIIRLFRNDSLKNEEFENAMVIETPIPKGFVTPEYLPPPPPPEKKNTPPIIVKDSIPVEKKEEKKKPSLEPPPLTDNKNSKDTAQNKPASGTANGELNGLMMEVDDYPSWIPTKDYPTPQDYIQKNARMPEIDVLMGNYGTVMIRVTIHNDGSLTDAVVVKGLSPRLNAEALRVVVSMPKWNPAVVRHQPVMTWIKIPVTFLKSNWTKAGN